VDLNERAASRLTDGEDATGKRITAVLGASVDDLAATGTLELLTRNDLGQFDVETIGLSTTAGTDLGALVSLRDVTRRQQREQGLDVLSRPLSGHPEQTHSPDGTARIGRQPDRTRDAPEQ